MKAFLLALLGGVMAGLVGLMLSYLTGYRLLTWTITGMLLALVIKIDDPKKIHWLVWVVAGGGVICLGYFIGHLILFPLVAWYIFGAVFVALGAPKRVIPKIIASLAGFMAGFLGTVIMPLITMVCMPLMGFSSSFAYDIEELGFIMTGILISMTAFLIKKWK